MINVGVGVDVSSVNKKNTHLTKGYTGGPDVNTDRKIRISAFRELAALPVLAGCAAELKFLALIWKKTVAWFREKFIR